MARLNSAFQTRSPSSAEKVVAQVNAGVAPGAAKPCPFEWRNGEAELSLATDLHGKLPLTQTINACADSIEQLPQISAIERQKNLRTVSSLMH